MLKSILVPFAVFSVVIGCRVTGTSDVKDIFAEDEGDSTQGNARRRPATDDEKSRVVFINKGCTGTWLTENYVLTASHCFNLFGPGRPIHHGTADRDAAATVSFEKMIERDPVLDYAILKVKHLDQAHAQKVTITKQIVVDAADVKINAQGPGEELFTVGYPQDKMDWKGTFAAGNAREVKEKRLYYDVGIINGNSGGSVFVKATGAMAAMTNGGKNTYGQAGWNNNALDNQTAWNYGSSLWEIYDASKFLKAVYPNGSYDAAAEKVWIDNGGGDDIAVTPPPPPPNPHGRNLIDFHDLFFDEASLLKALKDYEDLMQVITSSGPYSSARQPPRQGLDVEYAPEATEPCEIIGYTSEFRGDSASAVKTILLRPRLRDAFCVGMQNLDMSVKAYTNVVANVESTRACNQTRYTAESDDHGKLTLTVEALGQERAACKQDRVDIHGKVKDKAGTERKLYGARFSGVVQ